MDSKQNHPTCSFRYFFAKILLEAISSLNKHIIACVEGYDRVTLITW